MPKKRNAYWSRTKKEKQIITARLMEISLKVDDCIYKLKPISAGEAEQYVREVSSYKLQCSGDERSLQVIEKLTRCMKAIILDHQELETVNHTMHNATSIQNASDLTGPISPVYSIPDEDRTQFTQIDRARPIDVAVANQDVEIIDLSNIGDDDLMYNDTSPTTTDYASSRITVEADIHRERYGLSLREAGDPLNITASDVNYSQSILHNFEGVEQIQQNDINIVSHGAVTGELVGNVGDKGNYIMKTGGLGKIPNNKNASIIQPNKTVKTISVADKPAVAALANTNKKIKIVQNKDPLKEINTYNNPLMTFNEKDNTISSDTFYPSTKNIPETQRRYWHDSNRTCTINDSSHTLNDFKNITQASQTHKVVNQDTVKNKANLNLVQTITFNAVEKETQPFTPTENLKIPINNTAILPETPLSTKKKRGPRKKKIIDENETKPKRVYRARKTNKENTSANTEKNRLIPIYNENVVNDLSWMENIRYVREIRADENDPKLRLEESFWDNCYLPADWSENEFL